jgi:hypothetical protein
LEIQEKMNLKPILNETSLQAHMELEFGVLGVFRKLMKYEVHSSKKKIMKMIFLHTSYPNSNRPVFGLKKIYGLN